MAVTNGAEKFNLFEVSSHSQSELLAQVRHVRLSKGIRVFSEGDRCSDFAFVVSGGLRVFRSSRKNKQITLYRVRENEGCAVNMFSVFSSMPALASAVTEDFTELMLLDSKVFRNWFSLNQELRDFVLRSIAIRLVDLFSLVEQVTFDSLDRRLASFLLQRFLEGGISYTVIETTHGEIAHELGTAREVVSRRLKKFERDGVVATGRGRLELLDTKLLTKVRDAWRMDQDDGVL